MRAQPLIDRRAMPLCMGLAVLLCVGVTHAAAEQGPPQADRLQVVKITGNAGWTPDDTKAEFAIDGDMETSWDAKGPKGVVDLTLDLGGTQEVREIWIAFAQPRRYTFDIRGSHTGEGGWVTAAEATSDGKARSWMRVALPNHNKRRYYRIKSHGNDTKGKEGWFNVAEVVVIGKQLNEPKAEAEASPAEPYTLTIPRVDGEGPGWTGKAVFSRDALSDFGDIHGRAYKQADATLEIVELNNEKFDRAVRFTSRGKTGDSGAVAFHARSSFAIAYDDMLLASFWLRCPAAQTESGTGEVQVTLGEASGKWRRFMTLPVNVGEQWRHVYLFGPAKKPYEPGEVRLAVNAGGWPQTIEIAGVKVANLGTEFDSNDLPRLERDIDYPGREPDAAWRKAAAARIEKHRKADLAVTVLDSSGKPIPGAEVHVAMQKHAFIFGTPASEHIIGGGVLRPERDSKDMSWRPMNQTDRAQYMRIIETYFNEVSVGMHPLNWESRLRTHEQRSKRWHFWGGTMEHFDKALAWFKDHDKRIRGHCISWTPTHEYPHRMPALVEGLDDVEAAHQWFLDVSIPRRINGAAGRIAEYDGINHPVMFREMPESADAARAYFREHPEAISRSAAIIKRCKELAPEALFYVNEGQVLPSDKRVEPYEVFIEELIAAGAKPDGIGFMGHFTLGSMPHPQTVYEKLERFAKFGLPMKLTELDVTAPLAEQTQADYLRDVFIIAFSHPGVVGINQWGFWAPMHWKGEGAALWREDWTPKPAGEVFMNLTRKQWWTDQTLTTDAKGGVTTRSFLGDYRIAVTLPDGSRMEQSATLDREGLALSFRK